MRIDLTNRKADSWYDLSAFDINGYILCVISDMLVHF